MCCAPQSPAKYSLQFWVIVFEKLFEGFFINCVHLKKKDYLAGAVCAVSLSLFLHKLALCVHKGLSNAIQVVHHN